MQEDVLEMEELELDGNFDQPLALGVPGPPGPSGITPHIGSNGNWFIGEKDTGISAGGSGGYVAQDAPPEDTSVLWIDTDDNSDDGFQEAVNYALAQAKASGEFDGDDYVLTDDDRNEIAELAAGLVEVPEGSGGGISVTGATVGQTVKISAVDENGVPTAWEPMDVSYTKQEIDAIMGSYVTDIDNLLGGDV